MSLEVKIFIRNQKMIIIIFLDYILNYILGGIYMWEVLNKDEYFISRDGGTTWRWYQNGELLANLDLYNVNNGVVTLREVEGKIWIALGSTQAKWGRRPNSINKFFEYGRWTIQGNSLEDNASRGSDLSLFIYIYSHQYLFSKASFLKANHIILVVCIKSCTFVSTRKRSFW